MKIIEKEHKPLPAYIDSFYKESKELKKKRKKKKGVVDDYYLKY